MEISIKVNFQKEKDKEKEHTFNKMAKFILENFKMIIDMGKEYYKMEMIIILHIKLNIIRARQFNKLEI